MDDKYEVLIEDKEVIVILHEEIGDFVGSIKVTTENLSQEDLEYIKYIASLKADISHTVKMTEVLNKKSEQKMIYLAEIYNDSVKELNNLAEINNSYMAKYFDLSEAITLAMAEISDKIAID